MMKPKGCAVRTKPKPKITPKGPIRTKRKPMYDYADLLLLDGPTNYGPGNPGPGGS